MQLDCLQEGEIYVRFSEAVVDPVTLDPVSVLTGDVLVLREPTLLPTDVRKVKAVNKIELAMYSDVVIFPSKGKHALCALLGGGSVANDV
jgi:RNA-dependent RNA polymerase